MSATLEPDHRPAKTGDKEPDWDTIQPTYEAPGARDVVPDMPPVPDVTTFDPPKDNWAWQHDDWHNKKDPVKPLPPINRELVTEEDPDADEHEQDPEHHH